MKVIIVTPDGTMIKIRGTAEDVRALMAELMVSRRDDLDLARAVTVKPPTGGKPGPN